MIRDLAEWGLIILVAGIVSYFIGCLEKEGMDK